MLPAGAGAERSGGVLSAGADEERCGAAHRGRCGAEQSGAERGCGGRRSAGSMSAKERPKGKVTKDSVTLLPCFYFVEVSGSGRGAGHGGARSLASAMLPHRGVQIRT